MKPTHDLCVKTGEYTDNQGLSRARWLKIGAVFTGPDGSVAIKLDCYPVGVPDWGGWVSVFKRDSNGGSGQGRPQGNGQPQGGYQTQGGYPPQGGYQPQGNGRSPPQRPQGGGQAQGNGPPQGNGQQPYYGQPPASPPPSAGGGMPFDDDIPF